MKVILFPTKCLSGASGAPPCAGPGERVTGMPDRITRASHCSGNSTSCGSQPSVELTKLGVPTCAKHCFQHQCSRLKRPTHFPWTGCKMVRKTLSPWAGKKWTHKSASASAKCLEGRKGGKEGKRDRANI